MGTESGQQEDRPPCNCDHPARKPNGKGQHCIWCPEHPSWRPPVPPAPKPRPLACPNADGCEGFIVAEWVEILTLYEDGTHATEPLHEGGYRRWCCTACRLTTHDPRNWLPEEAVRRGN